MWFHLLILLGQVTAPPLSPPGGPAAYPAPTAAPTVQFQQAPAAGLGTGAYLAMALTALVGGGGAVATWINARSAERSKRIDVQAETAKQLPAVLAEVRKSDRSDIDRLWAKCEEQDKRLREVDAKLDALRAEKSDCHAKLNVAAVRIKDLEHQVTQRTAERDRARTRFQSLAAEHARCARPAPRPPKD